MKAVSNPRKFEADVEDWKNSKENLSNHIQLFLDLSVKKKKNHQKPPKNNQTQTKQKPITRNPKDLPNLSRSAEDRFVPICGAVWYIWLFFFIFLGLVFECSFIICIGNCVCSGGRKKIESEPLQKKTLHRSNKLQKQIMKKP